MAQEPKLDVKITRHWTWYVKIVPAAWMDIVPSWLMVLSPENSRPWKLGRWLHGHILGWMWGSVEVEIIDG